MSGPPMLGVDGCASTVSNHLSATTTTGSTTTGGLTVGVCNTTPLTPEILNSVMAMTNPLEYSFPSANLSTATTMKMSQVNSNLFLLVLNWNSPNFDIYELPFAIFIEKIINVNKFI